ncbi:MAG: TetR/AcrR family transcriptional regulator [Deltaproteobacteria bacterium]|nr:TetR/AcrR family transcriptional regulator [Deltaproteobacteria bacterium]
MVIKEESVPGENKKRKTKKGASYKVSTQIKSSKLVERRRKELVNASKKLFFEKGFSKTSIRDIARAGSFTMGNLYDYIQTKEDILYLVHENMVDNVYQQLFDIRDYEFSAKHTELESIIRNALEKSMEFQEDIILLYRESGYLSREKLHSVLSIESRYIDLFKRLLDEANKEGSYKIRDTKFLADLIVYLVAFPSLRRWSLRGYKKKEIIDLLMHYISPLLRSGERIRKKERKNSGQMS